MATTVNDELKKLIEQINDDDLKTMFGTCYSANILKNIIEATEKLEEYIDYIVPVSTGDIILFKGLQYCVTCVYTDNSVDICYKDGTRHNVGMYKQYVKVIDKMECIEED